MRLCCKCKCNEATGYSKNCRPCANAYTQAYRERTREQKRLVNNAKRREYREQHPDKEKAAKQRYRQGNAVKVRAAKARYQNENADKCREYQTNYRLENAGVLAAKAKQRKAAFYLSNKSLVAARVRRWREGNPAKAKEIARVQCANRRARKDKAEGRYTRQDVRRMFASQHGLCNGCRCSLADGYHVDHIIPLSRGGSNWPENLQLLCPACNCSKHNLTMEEFMKRRQITATL